MYMAPSSSQSDDADEDIGALREAIATLRKELAEQDEHIEDLNAVLAGAEERERQRIATGLHDEVGQFLAMAKLHLSRVCGMDPPEAMRASLAEVRNHVEQAIERMRSLTFELSSPQLFQLGLVPALFELANALGKDHELEIRISNDLYPKPLTDAAKNVVFQAVRELLFNVIKHAGARCATIDISRRSYHLHAAVRDDGCGFSVEELRRVPAEEVGFGLFSIEQRLRSVGGSMTIDSKPGSGTTVTIQVPLRD